VRNPDRKRSRFGEELRHESELSNPDASSVSLVQELDRRPRPQFLRYGAAVEQLALNGDPV
jgi:hypothetical protein